MNATWQTVSQVIDVGFSMRVCSLVAQSPTLPSEQVDGLDYFQATLQQIIQFLPRLVGRR